MHQSFEKKILKPSTMLAPVPVVMVSCYDMKSERTQQPEHEPAPHVIHQEEKEAATREVKQNLITIAWAGTICSDPPMVSISIRRERYSYDLIKESGEFVINTVSQSLTSAADFCGVRSGRDVDKFSACGLTPVPAVGMEKTSAIAESPLTLSCKLKEIVCLGSHDLFIGEIVGVEAQQTLFDKNNRLCLEKADLVAFAHGQYYSLGSVLGFFGYSVASDDVLKKRMPKVKKTEKQKHSKKVSAASKQKDRADYQIERKKKKNRPDKRSMSKKKKK